MGSRIQKRGQALAERRCNLFSGLNKIINALSAMSDGMKELGVVLSAKTKRIEDTTWR